MAEPLADINCIPNVPSAGSAIITENDKWQALRVGVGGEMMLINRLAISADAAYLPYVNFSGVDHHFFGNTGQIASVNPETSSNGAGVQLEALTWFSRNVRATSVWNCSVVDALLLRATASNGHTDRRRGLIVSEPRTDHDD